MKAKNRKHRTHARRYTKRHGRWLWEHACGVRDAWRTEKRWGSPRGALFSPPLPLFAVLGALRQIHRNKVNKRGSAYLPLADEQKKRCSPKRGTSSFVLVFLTRGKVGEAYQGERMSPSSAEGSSPQMGLMNCSIVPVSSPEPLGTSASAEPLRGLP